MGIPRIRGKKGMEFKSAIFAIIVLGILIVAFGEIIDTQADHYSSSAFNDLNRYNKLDDISNTSNEYRTQFAPSSSDPGNDAEANTFSGIFGILTNIFSTFDIFIGEGGMLDLVVVQLGLPSYFRQGIIALVLVAITFSLGAVIFRLSRRSV